MAKILLTTSMPKGEELDLHSRERKQISNEQAFQLTMMDKIEFADWEKRYPNVYDVRNNPTPIYNCHGLTFASRRTIIWEREALCQILNEDNYEEIVRANVKFGDVIIYFGNGGDFQHSGIVIGETETFSGSLSKQKQFLIVSKWGKYKEVIHAEYYCPYSPTGAKFYRIKG